MKFLISKIKKNKDNIKLQQELKTKRNVQCEHEKMKKVCYSYEISNL